MTIITLLLLLPAAAGRAWGGPADGKAAPSRLQDAVKAYEEGQAGKALGICLEGLEETPGDRELYLYAVEILPEERSKYAPLLHAATARVPPVAGDYARFLGLCKTHRNASRFTEALPNCRKALELEPTAWPVYRELGLTYSKMGLRKKSLEFFSQGVELSSGNYKAHYHLAAEYEKIPDRARALKYYRRALDLAKKAEGFDARFHSGIITAGMKRLSAKKERALNGAEGAAPAAGAGNKTAAPEPAAGPAKKAEAAPDPAAAAPSNARILKPDPSDAAEKPHPDEMNSGLLSKEEILAELRERRVLDAAKTELSEEDFATAKNMRAAEKHGAVDYLKSRRMLLGGFAVSRQTPGGVKLLLTLAGYKSYHSHLTRDAVAFFEKKGIRLQDVFPLKDLKGKPIFDPGGKLTAEGMAAYWQAQDGIKTWLLSYEAPPAPPGAAPPQKEKDPPEVERFMKDGYREIFEPEYAWLLTATDCPETTLTEKPGEILKLLPTPKGPRYFLCYIQGALCAMKGTAKLGLYIEDYRRGDARISKGSRSTDFFGKGGVEKRRFCHNGKIWLGD